MLLKDFWFYFGALFAEGLMSWPGLLGLAVLLGAVIVAVTPNLRGIRFRAAFLGGAIVAGLALLVLALYSAEYTFPEQPDSLNFATLPPGEPTCGTAETLWNKASYGMGNPCGRGCYRGLVLAKKMRLRGFPPWPEYQRVLQCWSRDGGSSFVN